MWILGLKGLISKTLNGIWKNFVNTFLHFEITQALFVFFDRQS